MINVVVFSTCDRKTLLCYVQRIIHLSCQVMCLNLNPERKENLLLKGLLHIGQCVWTLSIVRIGYSFVVWLIS